MQYKQQCNFGIKLKWKFVFQIFAAQTVIIKHSKCVLIATVITPLRVFNDVVGANRIKLFWQNMASLFFFLFSRIILQFLRWSHYKYNLSKIFWNHCYIKEYLKLSISDPKTKCVSTPDCAIVWMKKKDFLKDTFLVTHNFITYFTTK